jgi:hypothetical protein
VLHLHLCQAAQSTQFFEHANLNEHLPSAAHAIGRLAHFGPTLERTPHLSVQKYFAWNVADLTWVINAPAKLGQPILMQYLSSFLEATSMKTILPD